MLRYCDAEGDWSGLDLDMFRLPSHGPYLGWDGTARDVYGNRREMFVLKSQPLDDASTKVVSLARVLRGDSAEIGVGMAPGGLPLPGCDAMGCERTGNNIEGPSDCR